MYSLYPLHNFSSGAFNITKEARKEEQQGEIVFLTAGVSGSETETQMSTVYDENIMSHVHVFEWNKQFQERWASFKDSSQPAQAHCVITYSITTSGCYHQKWSMVENIWQKCEWNFMKEMLGISHCIVQTIFTEHLKYQNVHDLFSTA